MRYAFADDDDEARGERRANGTRRNPTRAEANAAQRKDSTGWRALTDAEWSEVRGGVLRLLELITEALDEQAVA